MLGRLIGLLVRCLEFNASSRFCKRWENFASQMKILKTPPLENGLVQEILHLGNLWRTKFLVTLDSFHGRESISVDSMIKYILYNRQTKC